MSVSKVLSLLFLSLVLSGCFYGSQKSSIVVGEYGYLNLNSSSDLDQLLLSGYWLVNGETVELLCMGPDSYIQLGTATVTNYFYDFDFENDSALGDILSNQCAEKSNSVLKKISLFFKIDNTYLPVLTKKNAVCVNDAIGLDPNVIKWIASYQCLANDARKSTQHGTSNEVPGTHALNIAFLKTTETPGSITPPNSMLFVGNSLTWHGNLPLQIQGFYEASGRSLTTEMIAPGGSWFADDINNPLVDEKLASGIYEAVFFQGGATESDYNPESMQLNGTGIIEKARSYGVNPSLYMTWKFLDHDPEHLDNIISQYTILGTNTSTAVAPVGIAARIYLERNPSQTIYFDTIHPNALGAYLRSATIFAFLTGESPVGSSYDGGAYDGGVDPALIEGVQQAAWDAVQAYGQYYSNPN